MILLILGSRCECCDHEIAATRAVAEQEFHLVLGPVGFDLACPMGIALPAFRPSPGCFQTSRTFPARPMDPSKLKRLSCFPAGANAK